MEQRRISMADIVVGKPLPWDVYDSNNKLLLRKGHVVQREQQVETLVLRGLFVTATSDSAGSIQPGPAAVRPIERPSALRLLNLATKRLERLLFNLHNESELYPKIVEVVAAIRFAVDINPDVALGCILLNQDAGSYPVRHGVDCAVVSLLVARAMNKPPQEAQAIMAAALLMNVGMLRHHEHLHRCEQPLSAEEHALIRNHPEQSASLLRDAGIADENVLNYVLLHHENEDGSGYPRGKRSAEIPENAKILALADRYCARVSSRLYRKAMLPNAALRDILLTEKKNIQPLLAACFIRELGTYPTGSFVRLVNGEVGVVTGRGSSTTTPVVHALIGPRGAPLSFPIRRETHKELHAIREVLHEAQAGVRISMQQLWGTEAAL
ncbi:HD-GYP domain-containing protein [Noviherbaspirillum sp.]|uniref:HD-GYP domain-containing protein n=1 Tax=Noviherbaspirillum sp. TaxID=1926288 RepID=UPI002D2C3C41|nr:HD domain-containing phosphohydrolase [Noviherbaspirillum sp.]HZW21010.1 HD domain-containing phosphohydrolase [Noviherbaspirillum sp.]